MDERDYMEQVDRIVKEEDRRLLAGETPSPFKLWEVTERDTGEILGVYEATNKGGALFAALPGLGYESMADAVKQTGMTWVEFFEQFDFRQV